MGLVPQPGIWLLRPQDLCWETWSAEHWWDTSVREGEGACMDEQGAPGQNQTHKGTIQKVEARTGSLGERWACELMKFNRQCASSLNLYLTITNNCGALHPALGPPPWEGYGPVGLSPEESHQDIQKAGAPLLWREVERVGLLQPGEEKVLQKP